MSSRDVAELMEIRLPAGAAGMEQDQEWCEVGVNGATRRIRFHDYAEIYSVPGLYERLFCELLECKSPETVCGLLREELARAGERPGDLTVLELGAGNGMVAEELAGCGADTIVGVDIIEEAAMAAERDRPGVYDDYRVLDFTDIPPPAREELEQREFDCLVTVAALGFGDIPPLAFAEAFNLIADDGWVVFNIKESFLSPDERGGFSRLINRMLAEDRLELCAKRRYRHRLAADGEPIDYFALVARKLAAVPLSWT